VAPELEEKSPARATASILRPARSIHPIQVVFRDDPTPRLLLRRPQAL
jgi:hypothetical protein